MSKIQCPECNGNGMRLRFNDAAGHSCYPYMHKCSVCGGTGRTDEPAHLEDELLAVIRAMLRYGTPDEASRFGAESMLRHLRERLGLGEEPAVGPDTVLPLPGNPTVREVGELAEAVQWAPLAVRIYLRRGDYSTYVEVANGRGDTSVFRAVHCHDAVWGGDPDGLLERTPRRRRRP